MNLTGKQITLLSLFFASAFINAKSSQNESEGLPKKLNNMILNNNSGQSKAESKPVILNEKMDLGSQQAKLSDSGVKKILKVVFNLSHGDFLQINDDVPHEQSKNKHLTAFNITFYIGTTLASLFIIFYGWSAKNSLTFIIGFFGSYYGLLFFLTEYRAYSDNDEFIIKITVVAVAVILGLLFLVSSVMFRVIQDLVLGPGMIWMITMFVSYFWGITTSTTQLICLLVFHAVLVLCWLLLSAANKKEWVICGAALIGSMIIMLNLGLVFDGIAPFEKRGHQSLNNWYNCQIHYNIAIVLAISGIVVQSLFKAKEEQDAQHEVAPLVQTDNNIVVTSSN